MTTTAVMQYETDEMTFRWGGGEYIEYGVFERDPDAGIAEWRALDVINVWDYELAAPRIPRTLDAFQLRCDDWIAENS